MTNKPIIIESNIIIFLLCVFFIIKLFNFNSNINEPTDKYKQLKKVKLNFTG